MITKLNPDAIDNASINMDKLADDVKELLDTNQERLIELEQHTVENTTAINTEKSRAEEAEAALGKLFEAPHPKMTVGYARNLIMPSDPEEQEFNFRQSGGGVIEDGVAVIDKVKGNSVVWNQIIAKPYTFGMDREFTFSSWYNGGSRSINDKGQFVFITNEETTGVGNSLCITPRNTHKYLLSYKVKADIASVCTIYQRATSGVIANIAEADKWYFVSCIADNTDTGDYSSSLNAVVAANSPETTVTIDEVKVTNLTQMFGAGNEPSTVEEFISRKPKVADEYAYNEGTIVNNKVEKVVTTGRNIWDEEWEVGEINEITCQNQTSSSDIRSKNFIRVIGGNNYFFKNGGNGTLRIFQYDADKNPILSWNSVYNFQSIKNGYFSLQANCVYIRFYTYNNYGATYNHDICINLLDASFNGQYTPYEKHELDLSWIKEIKDENRVALFEDGMRSAGTAYDEVAKGRAIKRIGVKVFDGTENWVLNNYANKEGHKIYELREPTMKASTPNIICAGWDVKRFIVTNPKTINYSGNQFLMCLDDTSSIAEWKSYLADLYAQGNPLTVYYELAEPIEVEYNEKNLIYPVVASGTEEAIASEPSSAFRADIVYGIDAVKTILDLRARVKALEEK